MDDGVCHWSLHRAGEQAGHGETMGQGAEGSEGKLQRRISCLFL